MASTSKQPTVEEASPSPPVTAVSLPEQSAEATISNAGIEKAESSGGSDEQANEGAGTKGDEEPEEEWDPAAESLPGGSANVKGKGKQTADAGGPQGSEQPWQAVWSPEQNAWYFWNTQTGAVTWMNPLQPEAAQAASTAPPLPKEQPPLPAGPPPTTDASGHTTYGVPPDIDPDLAHLLPPAQRGSAAGGPSSQTALFNARTGRFTPADYSYSVDHLDEYNRAKRMNSHYFDVDAWEKQKAEENAKRKRDEESGVVSNKKITKKDMERFRKKAQEKKLRTQAWLRE